MNLHVPFTIKLDPDTAVAFEKVILETEMPITRAARKMIAFCIAHPEWKNTPDPAVVWKCKARSAMMAMTERALRERGRRGRA